MAKTRTIVRYRSRPKGRHKAAGMTVPLAIIGGLVPMGADILSAYRVSGVEAALGHVSLCTTGYDPADGKFKPMFAVQKLYGPLLLGALVHKLAGKLGINRAMGKAGIPLFRV